MTISNPIYDLILGNNLEIMATLPSNYVDFILTDPPYLVNYIDRTQRSIANDINADWLMPTFNELYRVLKPNSMMVSFYGWTKVDLFFAAWKAAGFRVVGHIVYIPQHLHLLSLHLKHWLLPAPSCHPH